MELPHGPALSLSAVIALEMRSLCLQSTGDAIIKWDVLRRMCTAAVISLRRKN